MKTPLRLFIIASLALFGLLYYYSGQVEDHYQNNAGKFLRQSMTEISDWEAATLKSYLARETLANVNDTQLESLLERYRHLGDFQSMDEPVFSRISGAMSVFAENPRLGYSSRVRFSNGNAIMTATLTLEDKRFRYYNLSLGESQTN